MNIFVLFATILGVSDAYRILCFFPYTGKSHHMVFEPLLQELSSHGHHLTVVSFFPSSTPLNNRREVSLVGLAPLNVEVVDLKDFDYSYWDIGGFFRDFNIITGLAELNLKLCEKLLNSVVFKEFVEARGDYDVILLEHFQSDCLLGLVHNYGLPSVGLMSSALLPWSASRVGGLSNPAVDPNMMLPFTDEMTFLEKIKNAFYTHFYNVWFEYLYRGKEQAILERILGRKLPVLADVGRNSSVVLVNTHHTWNGVKVVPPSIVEVGGIHLHNKSLQPLPESLQKWINEAEHGVIVFSFGTLIRSSSLPPKRLDAILKVFARIKQRVVWKWENDNIKDLPRNVLVVNWLPQYDLLRHPNTVAFITHGGLLGLTETVAAGVPALVLPVLGDQPGNAAHASRAGFALRLSWDDVDEDTMYAALIKVLSPEMRSRAKSLSEMWWDRPVSPMDLAVFYVERTARYTGLHMSSSARWCSGLTLALFDSLGLLLLIVIVLLLLGVVWRRFGKSGVKEKQC